MKDKNCLYKDVSKYSVSFGQVGQLFSPPPSVPARSRWLTLTFWCWQTTSTKLRFHCSLRCIKRQKQCSLFVSNLSCQRKFFLPSSSFSGYIGTPLISLKQPLSQMDGITGVNCRPKGGDLAFTNPLKKSRQDMWSKELFPWTDTILWHCSAPIFTT